MSNKDFEGTIVSVEPPKGRRSSHWVVMPVTMVNPAPKSQEELLADLNSVSFIAGQLGKTREQKIADEAKKALAQKNFQTEAKIHHHPSLPSLRKHTYEPIPDDRVANPQKPVKQRSVSVDDKEVQNNSHIRYPSQPVSSQTSPTLTLQNLSQSAIRPPSQDDLYDDYVNIPSPVARIDQGQSCNSGHNQFHSSPPSPHHQNPNSQGDHIHQLNTRFSSHNPYNLSIGSQIQIMRASPNEPPRYGVIKWIGGGVDGTIAGIELVSAVHSYVQCINISYIIYFSCTGCVFQWLH